MNPSKWAALAKAIKPQLNRYSEDARAHAISLIPDFRPKPERWRKSEECWVAVQAQNAARAYDWKEPRRGLKMRNGATNYAFLELDSPMEVDGDLDTYHAVIPGGHSPELWWIGFETAAELMATDAAIRSERGYRSAATREAKRNINRG